MKGKSCYLASRLPLRLCSFYILWEVSKLVSYHLFLIFVKKEEFSLMSSWIIELKFNPEFGSRVHTANPYTTLSLRCTPQILPSNSPLSPTPDPSLRHTPQIHPSDKPLRPTPQMHPSDTPFRSTPQIHPSDALSDSPTQTTQFIRMSIQFLCFFSEERSPVLNTLIARASFTSWVDAQIQTKWWFIPTHSLQ